MADFEKPKTREKVDRSGRDGSRDGESDGEIELGVKRKGKFEMLKRAEERERYQERILMGEASKAETAQRFSNAIEDLKSNPALLTKISPHLAEHLSRVAKATSKEKAEAGEFPARYEAELDRMALSKKAEFFFVTTNRKGPFEGEDFENFDREIQGILQDYVVLEREQQLEIASAFKGKWEFNGDAELLRKMMIVKAKEAGDIGQMRKFAKDKKAMTKYIKLIEQGKDSETALEEAVKNGSPELQKDFQDYFRQWQSPGISDVFPQNPSIVGIKVEMPSNDQVLTAVAAYKQEGVRIDILQGNHAGIIYIGDAITREAAIYLVDGAPKFFIYDHNADGGIRGPIDSDQAQEVFFEISVDDYFSRRFREFSTMDSEKDPTKVADNKLLKMVHAFFQRSELREINLDVRARQLLDNLAHLSVSPDKRYLTMAEKIAFFDRIISNPLSAWAARNLLSERNFTQSNLSIFEEELTVLFRNH